MFWYFHLIDLKGHLDQIFSQYLREFIKFLYIYGVNMRACMSDCSERELASINMQVGRAAWEYVYHWKKTGGEYTWSIYFLNLFNLNLEISICRKFIAKNIRRYTLNCSENTFIIRLYLLNCAINAFSKTKINYKYLY